MFGQGRNTLVTFLSVYNHHSFPYSRQPYMPSFCSCFLWRQKRWRRRLHTVFFSGASVFTHFCLKLFLAALELDHHWTAGLCSFYHLLLKGRKMGMLAKNRKVLRCTWSEKMEIVNQGTGAKLWNVLKETG